MTNLKAGLVAAVVVVCAAILLVMQQQARVKLREENQSLRQQVGQLAKLQAENRRLSNLLAQANAAQALTKDQLSELMRLRGEAGLLRRQTNDLAKLREQNRRLQTSLTQAGQDLRTTPNSPQGQLAQTDFPKESWAFAGYATPEAALQSWAWAMSVGDRNTMLASLTAESKREFEKEIGGKSDDDLKKEAAQGAQNIAGFKLLKRETLRDDEIVLTVSTVLVDGQSNEMKMKIVSVGDQWKVAGPKDE